MKVVVCGGRNEHLSDERLRALTEALWQLNDGLLVLLLGGASGIDEDVRRASIPLGYPYRLFPADWKTHGKVAGPLRNAQMASEADAVIAFPGGRGTADMVGKARKIGIPVTLLD